MSRFGNAHWWSLQAPLLLAIALLLGTAVHLAWRSAAWLNLLRSEPVIAIPRPQAPVASLAPQQLAKLFGLPPRAAPVAPPATTLRLTLHGSFVHPDPARSSAIIQRDGGPAKRQTVNSQLEPGVRLHAVYPDRVEIERNGQLETLPFPRYRQTLSGNGVSTAPAPASAPAVSSEQLAMLQEESFKQLRERMATLRQRIQGNTAEAEVLPPPTDSPTQSD
ncbi:MAG TPA: type II secretion system protein N [Pseudomonas sp.]|nr:type II secretion system protein N [Pseudomonas sp.]